MYVSYGTYRYMYVHIPSVFNYATITIETPDRVPILLKALHPVL